MLVGDQVYNEMTNADAKNVSRVAMKVMDSFQHEQPADQILGVASLIILLEEVTGVKVIEALNVASNILNDSEKIVEFKGIKAYMSKKY